MALNRFHIIHFFFDQFFQDFRPQNPTIHGSNLSAPGRKAHSRGCAPPFGLDRWSGILLRRPCAMPRQGLHCHEGGGPGVGDVFWHVVHDFEATNTIVKCPNHRLHWGFEVGLQWCPKIKRRVLGTSRSGSGLFFFPYVFMICLIIALGSTIYDFYWNLDFTREDPWQSCFVSYFPTLHSFSR